MDAEQLRNGRLVLISPYLQDSARKNRLLAAAFCRHVVHLVTKKRCENLLEWAKRLSAFGDQPVPKQPDCLLSAIEEVERCADGFIPAGDLASASEIADRLSRVAGYYFACRDEDWGEIDYELIASSAAAEAIYYACQPRVDIETVHKRAAQAVHRAKGESDDENRVDPDEEKAQCEMVCDVYPNPPPTLTAAPAWLTPTVNSLADAIYAKRAFDRLPILADALEDAGCTNRDILDHCRQPGVHVRGCWVVDLVLGRK